ncbi:MAG TPA: hypothetical protein VKU02_00450 [Gemmataceae bacterium]|nr:hypothetical protein [Gemmataceae bacterium]
MACRLAALAVYALWQLIPMSPHLLHQLAPATAEMYEQLLPAHPEILPFGETRANPPYPAGSCLSFYPGLTRYHLFQLLAVFLLFAIARNNLASHGSLRRLSIATLVNGSLLSLFALVQFFASSAHTVYWSWQAPGTVFGPFVYRNHFPFYTNLCIGLSLGLLLECPSLIAERNASGRRDQTATTLLHDPAALWIIGGLAIMV